MKLRLITVASVLLGSAMSLHAGSASAPTLQDFTTRFMVRFDESHEVVREERQRQQGFRTGNKALLAAHLKEVQDRMPSALASGVVRKKMYREGQYVIEFEDIASKAEMNDRLAALKESGEFVLVEPDRIATVDYTPSDPLLDPHFVDYFDNSHHITSLWDIKTGNPNSVIAVVDSGILFQKSGVFDWADKPAASRVLQGYDFVASSSIDNDGQSGRDNDPSSVYSYSDHGTRVSSVIFSTFDNAIGSSGIDAQARLLPVRVLGYNGSGYESDTIDGLVWSAGGAVAGVPLNANPATIINASLGMSGVCGTSMQDAVNFVSSTGAMLISSAGNDNRDASNASPANCDNTISVAANNGLAYRSSFSNYSATDDVDMYAAGEYVTAYSPNNNKTSNTHNGTSFSAPIVTGIASLIDAITPGLTNAQFVNAVNQTGYDVTCTAPIPCPQKGIKGLPLAQYVSVPPPPVSSTIVRTGGSYNWLCRSSLLTYANETTIPVNSYEIYQATSLTLPHEQWRKIYTNKRYSLSQNIRLKDTGYVGVKACGTHGCSSLVTNPTKIQKLDGHCTDRI